jgi:Dyp-type peroxidase family
VSGYPSIAGAPLEPGNIQSDVIGGYGHDPAAPAPKRGAYVLLEFGSKPRSEVQQLLRKKELAITWANEWQDERTNVGFTYSGLKKLLDPEVLASAGRRFEDLRSTMAARSEALGDGTGASRGWEFSDGERSQGGGSIDAIVMFFGSTVTSDAHKRAESFQKDAETAGLRAKLLRGTALADDREHFGFVDGISQPLLEGMKATSGRVVGNGVVVGAGRWRPLRAGEIVLGHEDEQGGFDGSPFLHDGSFFVLRKLYQDVDGFHGWLDRQATRLDRTKDQLASLLMGRSFDGDPLISTSGSSSRNAFQYAQDPDGAVCPMGAHIRRTNPRDVSGRLADRSERHRMLRRSLMFAESEQGEYEPITASRGAELRTGKSDPSMLRYGMLFGCFCADIGRQFEVVQGGWINGGESAPRRLFTRDPVVGNNPSGTGEDVGSFTTVRGGAYFFVPGRDAYGLMVGETAATGVRLKQRVSDFRTKLAARLAPPATDPGVKAMFAQVLGDPIRSPPRNAVAAPRGGIGRAAAYARHELDHGQTETEQQTLVVLVKIREGEANKVRELLTEKRAELDQALATVRYPFAADGPRPSIHHARFLVTSQFQRFDDGDAIDAVPLGGPHLLFICRYDGSRSAVVRGLAGCGKTLPFHFCAGCPDDPASALIRFAWFVLRHEVPVAFAYQAYTAPVFRIQRALTLRERFVTLVADLSTKDRKGRKEIESFFGDEELFPHGASAPAEKRSK